MSDGTRVSHYWCAQARNSPQYRAWVWAVPLDNGRWRVRRDRLEGVCEPAVVECETDAEAIETARTLMAEPRILGEWKHYSR